VVGVRQLLGRGGATARPVPGSVLGPGQLPAAPGGRHHQVTADTSQCASGLITGTVEVENIGCAPVAGLEIVIEQELPLPPNPLYCR